MGGADVSTRADLATLPRVNTPVHVALPGVDHDVATRVEDMRGDLVVVAAVTVPGRLERHRAGDPLTLLWAAPPRGLFSVACLLVELERGTPPLWLLRPVGGLHRLQRRRYARADVAARVVLSGQSGQDPAAAWSVTGLVTDLSEGGARIVLGADQRLPPGIGESTTFDVLGEVVGEVVVVEIALSGGVVTTPAGLVAVDTLSAGRRQARLHFELSERDGERVRRAVMQRQVEARRHGGQP